MKHFSIHQHQDWRNRQNDIDARMFNEIITSLGRSSKT